MKLFPSPECSRSFLDENVLPYVVRQAIRHANTYTTWRRNGR